MEMNLRKRMYVSVCVLVCVCARTCMCRTEAPRHLFHAVSCGLTVTTSIAYFLTWELNRTTIHTTPVVPGQYAPP